MNKFLLLLLLFITISSNAQHFFKQVEEKSVIKLRDSERGIVPEKYSTFSIDMKSMVDYLKNAPLQFNKKGESLLMYLPMPDGSMMPFDVVNSPVMESELAVKYPYLLSFKGVSRTDKDINIRFNTGPRGFWASIYWRGNNIYIDPFSEENTDHCISYFTRDYKADISQYNLSCGVDDKIILDDNYESDRKHDNESNNRDADECEPVKQYNYTIAIACTGEWGKKHGNTVESALADIVTSVNRINQIYENEFAIHFNLSGQNDKLIWIDPATDPFENPNAGYGLLPVIGEVINNAIGFNSYDIGHVFTNSCSDVGGVAMLSGVCNGFKGNGVTCHYFNDLNYIVTNVTCHEIGHQFSAVHTFNNCGGNESGSGYEPGGGNSIMAYCGLCGGNNVNYPCTENFHSYSIEQIIKYTRIGGGFGCADKIETENTSPVVSLDYKNGFYIPKGTYFVLEGNTYDCEGDEMTYSWEEFDTGPQTPIGDPIDDSPIFAALEPSSSPVRYFPNLKSIINSSFNNSEILPDYSRNLSFRFIARDNHSGAGGTSWADMNFKVDAEAGPFKITFPKSAEIFRSGKGVEIKWDVANTNNTKINCKNVDIYMSADFGYTYPYLLKFRTPNDGSEMIYLPDHLTSLGKFMVKASDNIFFHVDKFGFSIKDPVESSFVFDIENSNGVFCMPRDLDLNITSRAINNYTDSIRFEIKDLPANTEYKFSKDKIKPGQDNNLKLDFSKSTDDGYFEAVILAISDKGDTLKKDITWQFYSNNYKNLEILNPVAGTDSVRLNTSFSWRKPRSVEYVNFYMSKDPNFPLGESFISTEIKDTLIIPDYLLDFSSMYYWKLEFVNECGVVVSDTIYHFTTLPGKCSEYVSLDVPVALNDNQVCMSDLIVENDLKILDLNVKMQGNHIAFKELRSSLISPDSTKSVLFTHKGTSYQGIFDLTFDDEAKLKLKTKPIGIFKPDSSMTVFRDKQAKGKWVLEIIDNKDQQSGSLKYFSLNICKEVIVKNPFLIVNNVLKIPTNAYWPISNEYLKVSDQDNTDSELIYTVVKTPAYSELYHSSIKLGIGDKFSQDDINNGIIKLRYPGKTNDLSDRFYFTVSDGTGGWIGITSFNFITDETVNNKDEIINYQISVYPNPANNYLNVQIENEGNFMADIIDMKGQKKATKRVTGFVPEIFDISGLNNGIYILRVRNEKYNYTSKFVKQK